MSVICKLWNNKLNVQAIYNLNGSLCSMLVFRLAPILGVSPAAVDFFNNLETAVGWSNGTGVLEPEGVLVLNIKHV